MRKREKTLTAILLTVALSAGSVLSSFAAEPVSGNEAAAEDEWIPEEAVAEESEDGIGEILEEDGTEETEVSADSYIVGESGAVDTSEEEPWVLSSEEAVSEDEAEGTAASEEGEKAELSDDTKVHEYVTIEKRQEYNGALFTPTYTVPTGYKLISQNKYDAEAVAKENTKYTFPAIKTVSESAVYYVYKTNAANNDDFDYKIEISVTRRPVTFRSGTYSKVEDGTPLSQNSFKDAVDPWVVSDKTMVKGESFSFVFDPAASITTVTNGEYQSVKNKFRVSENGTAEINNYDVSYEYGDLILSKARKTANDLPSPLKPKAVMDKKGGVKISWKKVKSFKPNGKKGGKTTYKVSRYREDGTWEVLTKDLKKAKYVDKTPKAGERLIYKIVAEGIDSSGQSGECKEPAYVRVTPKIISVTPYDGIHYANVNFAGLGNDTDSYTIRHWNTKKKSTIDDITVKMHDSNMSQSAFEGKTRKVSTNCYLDAGGDNVTISGNSKATFAFKVKANETKVYDYGEAKTIDESPWSKVVKLKMVSQAPYLVGKRESRTAFTLKWTKIKKATGYLVEYSRDSSFSKSNTTSEFISRDKSSKKFDKREYEVKNRGFGEVYYCRVTSYLKKKGDVSEYGLPLGTSQVITQYGRQKAVGNLKAEYYEDGNYRADAKLSWTDSEERVMGYYVQKWTYKYDSDIKDYVFKEHKVLQGYTSQNSTRKKYVETAGDKIENGDLVKYRVQSVIFEGGHAGEFRDGYVFSEPSEFFYMNPREVQFKKTKYKVKVGETLKPDFKFIPKKMPKTIDGLSKDKFKEMYDTEFSKLFLFNKKVDFTLESDEEDIKKYVTIDTIDKDDGSSYGVLKGKKEYKKNYITLKISSPNDPYNVYDTAIVNVDSKDDTESKTEEKKKTGLIVCIDPGHGGKDSGTEHNGIVEKDKNLEIAKLVRDELKELGATVYMTRTSDKYVSLTDRTEFADENDCNLFVSIHCNYSDNSSTRGTEVYYSVKSKYAKKKLAEKIADEVSDALDTSNRGARTKEGKDGDYYSVIRTSASKGIPGLIVEHAFVSNTADANALKSEDRIKKAAKAEAEAIWKNWK